MLNWTSLWINQGILKEEFFDRTHLVENIDGEKIVLIRDISANDSFEDILIYQFHGEYHSEDFKYEELIAKLDDYEQDCNKNDLRIFVSFDSWEMERSVIQKLMSNEKTAIKKNKIEDNFSKFNTIYFSDSDKITLKVDGDGVNFLTSPELTYSGELDGVVVNCSLFELKKLYNATGRKLFKNNVREGIKKNKSEIKSIFNKYLTADEDDGIETPNNVSEYQDYDTSLFWFSHNGITIFVDNENKSNFEFKYDSISLNPKFASVINGAQTVTNFFLLYSELKYSYKDDEEKIAKLEKLTKNTFVKLTIINGKSKYSSFITRGLNTQNPISEMDFVANSAEVKNINQIANGQIYILRTGEPERRGGLNILQFVKYYLIVESKPGTSKNFNKRQIEEKIRDINNDLGSTTDESSRNKRNSTFEKIAFIPEIEDWWNKLKKENSKKVGVKQLVDNYGKNYYQSFVLESYNEIQNSDDIESKFKELYEYFVSFFDEKNNESSLTYNVFKKDDLYGELVKKFTATKEPVSDSEFKENSDYEEKLKIFLNQHKSESKSIAALISEYNKEVSLNIENLRVIRRFNGQLKENFHLSTRTFSTLYQNINIEEKIERFEDIRKEDFPSFEQSTLYEELEREYNIYIVDYNDETIESINFLRQFKFDLIKNWSGEIARLYDETIDAFCVGDSNLFPKANKENKIHVRPKAQSKDDSFLFTDGEQLTKQTFWITKYYINDLLKREPH